MEIGTEHLVWAALSTLTGASRETARRCRRPTDRAPSGAEIVSHNSRALPAGNFLYVSGQRDKKSMCDLPPTIAAQVRQIYENLKDVFRLRACPGSSYRVSDQTVGNILRRNGVAPAPKRA